MVASSRSRARGTAAVAAVVAAMVPTAASAAPITQAVHPSQPGQAVAAPAQVNASCTSPEDGRLRLNVTRLRWGPKTDKLVVTYTSETGGWPESWVINRISVKGANELSSAPYGAGQRRDEYSVSRRSKAVVKGEWALQSLAPWRDGTTTSCEKTMGVLKSTSRKIGGAGAAVNPALVPGVEQVAPDKLTMPSIGF